MIVASRVRDVNWGASGASVFYRALAVDLTTVLVARTTTAESPALSETYVVTVSNWDTSWAGREIWDDGTSYYTEAFDSIDTMGLAVFGFLAANVPASNATVGRRLLGLIGAGPVVVDHNTGGADNLRYTYSGAGVSGGTVRAYLQSEFLAGTYNLLDQTTTGSDGRWALPMYLTAGNTYVLIFDKPGIYSAVRKDLVL